MSVRTTGGATNVPGRLQEAQALRDIRKTNDSQNSAQAEAQNKAEHALGEYQRPHRVHTSAERRAAEERKNQARLLDEAAKHAVIDTPLQGQTTAEVEEVEQRGLESISLDDERRRRKRKEDDQDAQDDSQKEETAARSLGLGGGASGKYFQDLPADRLGDMSLTNPNEMKRMLGPSVRFAQHAMMLADARMREGTPRTEALAFLASLYLGVADRAYANKALRDFGAATGILDLYPLEVVQHLLQNVPGFLSKVSTASFFVAVPSGGLKGEVGKPIVLRYDADLRVRGFAVRGGERPGYLFEPVDPPGTYHLTFATSGRFTVMISALGKDGVLRIEELAVEIKPGDARALDAAPAFQKTRSLDGEDEAGAPADAAPPATEGAPPSEPPPAPVKPKKDLKFTIPRKI